MANEVISLQRMLFVVHCIFYSSYYYKSRYAEIIQTSGDGAKAEYLLLFYSVLKVIYQK